MGLPVWRFQVGETTLEKRLTMPRGQNTVYITAVDLASTFNLSPEAFDDLTGGTGLAAGTVHARAVQVAASKCGL